MSIAKEEEKTTRQHAYPLAVWIQGAENTEHFHCLAPHGQLLLRLEEADEQIEQRWVLEVRFDHVASP